MWGFDLKNVRGAEAGLKNMGKAGRVQRGLWECENVVRGLVYRGSVAAPCGGGRGGRERKGVCAGREQLMSLVMEQGRKYVQQVNG